MTVEDKIKVFDSDDDSLKLFGELLSNETSRKIIKCLIEKEMYTNEIATKLDMRVSLVIHHLKKLEKTGLVTVTKKKIVRRGHDHRYFRMSPHMFLSPNYTKSELEEKGILKNIFKDGVKTMFLIFIGMFSFASLEKYQELFLGFQFSSDTPLWIKFFDHDISIITSLLCFSGILFLFKKRKKG